MNYFQLSNQAPSITDWIQTAVYILTAIGLFINFWFQRRSLQEQNRIRFIEEERDRRLIMPYFELIQEFDKKNNQFHLQFVSPEKSGRFFFLKPLLDGLGDYNIVLTEFKMSQKMELQIPLDIIKAEKAKIPSEKPLFNVEFMDKESRPYVQMLYFTGYTMYLSDPIEYYYIKKWEDKNTKSRFSFFKQIFTRNK